jgi:hypothetical protein
MPIWRKVLKFVCELWLGYPQTFSFMVFFNYWSKIFFCFFAKNHGKNVIFSRRRAQMEIGVTEFFLLTDTGNPCFKMIEQLC